MLVGQVKGMVHCSLLLLLLPLLPSLLLALNAPCPGLFRDFFPTLLQRQHGPLPVVLVVPLVFRALHHWV